MGYEFNTSLALQANTSKKTGFEKTTLITLSTTCNNSYLFTEKPELPCGASITVVRFSDVQKERILAEKVVNVRMSEDCHAILKAYCTFTGKTMSEVMYDWARQELHQQAAVCSAVQTLLDVNEKTVDPRAPKPCWGFRCLYCQHEKACRIGKDDRLFIMDKKWWPYLKPEAQYVKEFDGTSIDCCRTQQVFKKSN